MWIRIWSPQRVVSLIDLSRRQVQEWSLSYCATSFVLCYVLEFLYRLMPVGAMLERDYFWIMGRPYLSDFDYRVT